MIKMDVFEFIDKVVLAKQLPYIRLITLFITDGMLSNVCLVMYNDKKLLKKARKVGLTEEKKIIEIKPEVKITNPKPYNIEKGSFYLNYNPRTKELNIYRQ